MKFIREPLFQFVILGVIFFAIYAVASDRIAKKASSIIEITPAEIELLSATFERQWQRPPIDSELENLIKVRSKDALYEGLLSKYDVVIAGEPVPRLTLGTSRPATS